jgi:hypothetical protein
MRGTCSICSAAADIVAGVNAELLKPPSERKNLRELERLSGFSRSALSRHGRNCIPEIRLALNREKTAPHSGREVVRWPDGKLTLYGEPFPETAIRDTDLIFVVEYAKTNPATVGNPRALPATEENVEAFHELALQEDAERKPEAELDSPPA